MNDLVSGEELAVLLDAASTLAGWMAGELAKRWTCHEPLPFRRAVRRALPVIVPCVAAATRAGLEAGIGGASLERAIARGVVAGVVAVWLQNVRTATVAGDVDHAAGKAPEVR